MAVLEQLPNLQMVKLRIRTKSNGDDEKVAEFATDLIKFAPTKLGEVDLEMDYGFTTGDGQAPTAMANMIGALPSLKRFRVGQSSETVKLQAREDLVSSFIGAVAASVSSSKLESFAFNCPDTYRKMPSQYETLGEALASMPELREINMTGCLWGPSERDTFLRPFITKKPATFSKLLLKAAHLRDDDLLTVSKIIEHQPLEVIDISKAPRVFDQGLHHLSQALGNLQNLTPRSVPCHLREVYALELTGVTDRGIQELLKSLQNCQNLTLLDVSTFSAPSGLSAETILIAMRAMDSWPNLKRLMVTYMKRNYNLMEQYPLQVSNLKTLVVRPLRVLGVEVEKKTDVALGRFVLFLHQKLRQLPDFPWHWNTESVGMKLDRGLWKPWKEPM